MTDLKSSDKSQSVKDELPSKSSKQDVNTSGESNENSESFPNGRALKNSPRDNDIEPGILIDTLLRQLYRATIVRYIQIVSQTHSIDQSSLYDLFAKTICGFEIAKTQYKVP